MTDQVNEAVAFAVELPDGSIAEQGWMDMRLFKYAQKYAVLHEGCRYVFAYREAHPSRGVADDFDPSDARGNFTEWLAREMPPGTVVSDPRWWAPKIIRAFHDYRTVAQAAQPAVPSVPDAILRAFSDAAVDAAWAGTGFIRLTATDGEITAECVPASSVTLATPAHDQPEGSDNG